MNNYEETFVLKQRHKRIEMAYQEVRITNDGEEVK